MRHRVAFRSLSRPTGHRLLLLRNMVSSLIEHEQITTTVAKAKEAARFAEKVITMGKKGQRQHQSEAKRLLFNHDRTLSKLFNELANRYLTRSGGYTRINLFGHRKGDHAPNAILSLVDGPKDIKFSSTAMALGRHMAKMSVLPGNASAVALKWRHASTAGDAVSSLAQATETLVQAEPIASTSRLRQNHKYLAEEQPLLYPKLSKAVNSVIAQRSLSDVEDFHKEASAAFDRNLTIRDLGVARPDTEKLKALEAYYKARREAQALAKQDRPGGPAYIVPPMQGRPLRAGEDHTLRDKNRQDAFKSAIASAKGRQRPVRQRRLFTVSRRQRQFPSAVIAPSQRQRETERLNHEGISTSAI